MSRIRLWAAGAVLAVIAMFAMPTAASAHDQLLSSSPAADERLDTAPAQIQLDFSANILDAGAEILVVDADGTDVADGPLEIDGPTVTMPLRADIPEAGYQVRWRVVSSDGHPISGFIPFTIGDAAPMPLPTGDAAAADSDGARDTDAPAASDATTTDDTTLRTVLIGAGGAAVAIIALLTVTALRRRSRDSRADAAPTDSNS